MMANYIYCDSCVFLAYFKAEPQRIDTIEQLFQEVQSSPDRKLLTSVLTITEVSHVAEERSHQSLIGGWEDALDEFWADSSLLEFIEFHEPMARKARQLIRQAITLGYTLKPADAIHLASATYAGVSEYFTYDNRLTKFSAMTGLDIKEPYVSQFRLPGIR